MSSSNKGNLIGSNAPRTGGGFKATKNEEKKENDPKIVDDDEDYEDEEQDEIHEQEEIDNNLPQYGQRQKKTDQQKKSLDIIFDKATKQKEKQLIDKAYFQDGDPTMYTKENLEKRNALKDDTDVKKAIQKFMNLYTFDQDGKLKIESYLFVHTGLAELLRDDLDEEVNGEELKFILEQDWEHDSRGKNYMSKDDLYDSLFELVDIWVPEIDKEEQNLDLDSFNLADLFLLSKLDIQIFLHTRVHNFLKKVEF